MLALTPTKEICLRPYQTDAIDALRAAIRDGQRRLILCAPTGAGKTVLAAHLLAEADRKGSYSLFMVDRVALVDQTSTTLDDYGIRHGVVQGIHPRWAPHENVQVASIQTLARRGLPRSPSLLIWDEAHCGHKATQQFIDMHPDAVVIGLTATPFTKGMADRWGGVVNVRTTADLVADGFLIEPTIYVARAPEEADLSLNGMGEFSDASATAAGIRIVGDVVSEWIAKTSEHFGGPVKTIVFSPTVDHGRELCAAFGAAGFNFQQVSYLDANDDERRAKIEEFRQPDSLIHGLVSCGVLTKGFDVPDVKCIASGQRVLTDKGLVPIEKVTLEHKLWDGIEYVEHQGIIFKGYQHVIEYAGLAATPDHEVHTAQGWRTLGDCAAEQVGITQTGFGECAIWSDAGYFAGGDLAESWQMGSRACPVRMHPLRETNGKRTLVTKNYAANSWMQALLLESNGCGTRGRSSMAGSAHWKHEGALRAFIAQGVSGLRRAWHRISVCIAAILCGMGHRELRLAPAGQQHAARPYQQQWALRAGQSPLGIEIAQLQQYASWGMGGDDASFQDRTPGNPLCGQDAAQLVHDGTDLRAGRGTLLHAVRQAKRPVWDILQAGPRNRFTCEGLLVHNCGISCKPYRKSLSSHLQEIGRVMRSHPGKDKALWLCHSGNVERMAVDMFDVWQNGAGELDSASKRDSKPRERDATTKEAVVCPECGGVLRGSLCRSCGWEKPVRSTIHAVDGELREFNAAAAAMQPRAGLRAACLADPQAVWGAALAYCVGASRYGEEAGRKWAMGVWCGIYDGHKLPRGWFTAPLPSAPQIDALDLVQREVKRHRKSKRRAA